MSRIWGAIVAVTLLWGGFSVSPAKADWLRVESERFIIYSDGREADARAYIQTLESFDHLLRLSMGLDLEATPDRKLPIYVVGTRNDMERVRPGIGSQTVGFYAATNDDIFAVALRDNRDYFTLLHEYAHHFMLQNIPHNYPAWFVEGFAEYYMTASIRGNRVELGRFHEGRVYWLDGRSWLPLEDLLSKRPHEADRHEESYYPAAWLLAHWFLADNDRRVQLHAYLADVGGGGSSVEAMERATGLSTAELARELRSYLRGGIPYIEFDYPFPSVEVTVTRLPASADNLLLLNQRVRLRPPEGLRERTVEEIRRQAARHEDDPFARVVLARAEVHLGDSAAGEAILAALLAEQPDNLEALQLMAVAHMARSAEDGADQPTLMRQARGYLQRAFNIDDANYLTLMLIAQTRESAADYPTDNDLLTWRLAFSTAPQLGSTRLGLAEAFLLRGETAAAIAVLQPLANSPHGGESSIRAQQLIDQAANAADDRPAPNVEALPAA